MVVVRSHRRQYAPLFVVALGLLHFSCGGAVSAGGGGGNSPTPTPVIGSPVAALSAASLTFGNQTVGNTSAPQAITLSNTGTARLSLTSITVSGDFAQSNDCGPAVAVGANCTITVTFTPTAAGTRTGSLAVVDNAAGSPHRVTLSGTATAAPAPVVSLDPADLSFNSQVLNTSSEGQAITLSNTGTAALTITSIVADGDFLQANGCGTSVASGSNCAITVTFRPTATGARTGMLTVNDNAAGSPHRVSLNGMGVSTPAPAVSLTPASLTFPDQLVASDSAAQVVTLKNTGNASLNITSITSTGDFTRSTACGSTLAAGASCTISVVFHPIATGSRTGTLSVNDDATGSPHTVSLSGSGHTAGQISVSSSNLSFGNIVVGQSSSKTVTISNTGGSTVVVTNPSIDGSGFAMTGLSSSVTLAAGQSKSFTVTFSPTSQGASSGTVYLPNDSTTPNSQIALSGNGTPAPTHSVNLSWAGDGSAGVVGYCVYRAAQGSGYEKITTALLATTSYTDNNVTAGVTYSYAVTAVDGDDNESSFSNLAVANIPTP